MALFPLTALVTLLICLLLLATGAHVGRARTRYRIKAPAMTGHALFERAYRIQMNTLENAVIVLPTLWLHAAFLSDRSAAACGAAWLLARIWYAVAYQRNPDQRGTAFIVSLTASAFTWIGAAWGIVRLAMA